MKLQYCPDRGVSSHGCGQILWIQHGDTCTCIDMESDIILDIQNTLPVESVATAAVESLDLGPAMDAATERDDRNVKNLDSLAIVSLQATCALLSQRNYVSKRHV